MNVENQPWHEVFAGKRWDRPALDPNARGDADVSAIFHSVGFALTTWENAECALASLFQVMSNVTAQNAYQAVLRAFGSIESSAGRRRALEAAAEIYFGQYWSDPVVRKPFKDLMSAFEKASARRDDFAHGMAYSVIVDNDDKGAFLFPSNYNTGRTHAWMTAGIDPFAFIKAKYRYTSAEILWYADGFGKLWQAVGQYIEDVRIINGMPASVIEARFGAGAVEKLSVIITEEQIFGKSNPEMSND